MTTHHYRLRSCLWLSSLVMLFTCALMMRAAKLGVSSSGRFLTVGGKPFFWLGDTVWLLAQVPSRDEIELYLRTRAEQGFTVIQLTAVMGEERVWGTTRATAREDTPFLEGNVLKPAVTPGSDPADPMQYDYWDHLDYPNGNVWHFDTCKPELTQTWTAALQSPGAASLRHAKRFLTTIEWWKYVPDASLFAEGEGSGGTRNVAMRSSEGDAIAVYFASPATVKLRLDKIAAGCKFAARWTNPATGEERSAGTFDRQPRSFTPPSGWSDALLHVAAKSQKPK